LIIIGTAVIPITRVINSGAIPFSKKKTGRITAAKTLTKPSVKYRLPKSRYLR
jgi:hypothetical protein